MKHSLDEHPAVRALRARHTTDTAPQRAGAPRIAEPARPPLDAAWLRDAARELGADDVGLVALDRPELDDQRAEILRWFPPARALVSFVVRMNREPLRSTSRSTANLEFHGRGHDVDAVGHALVRRLEERGVAASNPAMGFPMEMGRFPGRIWDVSHKPVAEAAGLGRMGLHRNLIHPRFGSFVLLGTVAVAADVTEQDFPVAYDPCVSCKLCVAACPVGAIAADGHFDFSGCMHHNYNEFMGGFTTWTEDVADSRSARDYRSRRTDAETVSMWQSLAFGPNYKAAYCLAVCPAGEEVLPPFLEDRGEFLSQVVKPLQGVVEPVYAIPGTDAEAHARRRFPHKPLRAVGNALRPTSAAGFLRGIRITFQREAAGDLDATFHFRFTGDEQLEATVRIANGALDVQPGLAGEPDLVVSADAATWVGFLRKDRALLPALLTRRVRLQGSPRLLLAFARCFPG